MGVAGAVDHLRTRRRQERLRQGMTDPVRALNPRTVVPAARRLESGPHRQKVLDGDGPLPCIREVRKVLPDRIVQRQQLPVRCDADERSDDALGNGLDVRGRRRAAAVEVPLEKDRAALRYEKTVQSRKLECSLDRRIQSRQGVRSADLQVSQDGYRHRHNDWKPCALHRPSIRERSEHPAEVTPFNQRPQKVTPPRVSSPPQDEGRPRLIRARGTSQTNHN